MSETVRLFLGPVDLDNGSFRMEGYPSFIPGSCGDERVQDAISAALRSPDFLKDAIQQAGCEFCEAPNAKENLGILELSAGFVTIHPDDTGIVQDRNICMSISGTCGAGDLEAYHRGFQEPRDTPCSQQIIKLFLELG